LVCATVFTAIDELLADAVYTAYARRLDMARSSSNFDMREAKPRLLDILKGLNLLASDDQFPDDFDATLLLLKAVNL